MRNKSSRVGAEFHGIARLFLECGAHNLNAQQFFKGRGFQQVSVVMLRELDGEGVHRG